MHVSLVLAILALLTVPFGGFCHFVPAQFFTKGCSVNMAISGKSN
jgi:hypothetical protein